MLQQSTHPQNALLAFIGKYHKVLLLLMVIISVLLHFRIFRLDLVGIHVWRQTQTQTAVNNFYTEDMNILHPRVNEYPDGDRIMRIEFPLMQWLFACCYKLFGPHIFISRLLSFIIGLFSVWGIYKLGGSLFGDKRIAFLAAWTFNFAPVFYYYTVNPLPDNLALCMGIWSAYYFFRLAVTKRISYAFYSALFLCIGAMVKLPFILYGALPLVYLIGLLRKDFKANFPFVLKAAAIYFVLALPIAWWYLLMAFGLEGNGVLVGLFAHDKTFLQLLDILQGVLISLLPEELVNYASVLFLIAGLYFFFKHKKQRSSLFPPLLGWAIAIMLYYVFEINMIGTVHDYYFFPFLPLIFLLVAYGAHSLSGLNKKVAIGYTALALCILPLTAFLRIDTRWNVDSPGFNPAYNHYQKQIQALIPANAYVVTGNDPSHYINLYYLNRKGWTFDNDQLNVVLIENCIAKGAKYLCSNSNADTSAAVRAHLKQKVFEQDGLRIYQLQ